MRRPWWLFYGVAREAPRMRYYTDLELLLRHRAAALAEIFRRNMIATQQAVDTTTAALTPALRSAAESFRQFGEAFNRSRSLS